MKFSLVMATVGRTQEVERLLASLATQSLRNFELIVVDQNQDDRLEPLLEPYREAFPILHLASKPGLSRARNVGLEHATGDIVAFPDDDCWYPPDLLQRVAELLNEHRNLGGVTGRPMLVTKQEQGEQTPEHGRKVGAPRFDKEAGLLDKTNTLLRAISYTIFLRRSVVEKVGGFDESLGVGAGTLWGSAEDTDYALRAVATGAKVYFEPELYVYHLVPPDLGSPALADRAYRYGVGMGRIWQKHDFPLWLVAYYLLRPAGGGLLGLLRVRMSEVRYYFNCLRGRLRGWLSNRCREGSPREP
jgi:glycosyltransferase involved in cell wall biosynthesis